MSEKVSADPSDEPLRLSSSTLAALASFEASKVQEGLRFEELRSSAQAQSDQVVEIDCFEENWNLSQFWYTNHTADALAHELLDGADETARIGVLCAPSVYPHLMKRNARDAWLFEFDQRFEVLGGAKFIKYDYNQPIQLPENLKGTFDRLIIDPPFLSDECELKAAITARWLARPDARLIVCSGAKMRELLVKFYKAEETIFRPCHKNGLSNEFLCLLNYSSDNSEFAFVTRKEQ